MRPKYWMGVFPNRVECELSPFDLEAFVDMPERRRRRAIAPHAYVRIQRLALRGVARRAELTITQLLAAAPDEHWNHDGADYVVFVWDTSDTERLPVGFATFSVSIFDNYELRTKATETPIHDVSFQQELVFVRPDKRGIGFGRYLSCGTIMWLEYCRLVPPRCPSAGVNVVYSADLASEGGEFCSGAVVSHFEYLQDLRRDSAGLARPIPWLIASFTNDSGY